VTKERRGWKATRRKPQPRRGGDDKVPLDLPRSLGLTLECVRRELDKSLPEMVEALYAVPQEESPWLMPKVKADPKNPGGMVANWENAKTSPVFAALHRYGLLSSTLAGVLLIGSHFYAHLRDAADGKHDKDREIDALRTIARKLRCLADRADAVADRFTRGEYAKVLANDTEDGDVRARHLEVISEILDGYRERPLKGDST